MQPRDVKRNRAQKTEHFGPSGKTKDRENKKFLHFALGSTFPVFCARFSFHVTTGKHHSLGKRKSPCIILGRARLRRFGIFRTPSCKKVFLFVFLIQPTACRVLGPLHIYMRVRSHVMNALSPVLERLKMDWTFSERNDPLESPEVNKLETTSKKVFPTATDIDMARERTDEIPRRGLLSLLCDEEIGHECNVFPKKRSA